MESQIANPNSNLSMCTSTFATTLESHDFGLPCKQKISVNKFGFEKVKLERNADDFGRESGGGLKPWKNKAEKFAEKVRNQNLVRNSPARFLKFA